MKTIKEIEKDILEAQSELEYIRKNKEKGENSISAKIKVMRLAKNYLEFKQATIDAVKSQKENVTRWLQIDTERFDNYCKKNEKVKVDREMYYKNLEINKVELAKWRSELKFLNYLLS